jgi:hypothetical protein
MRFGVLPSDIVAVYGAHLPMARDQCGGSKRVASTARRDHPLQLCCVALRQQQGLTIQNGLGSLIAIKVDTTASDNRSRQVWLCL